MSKENLLDLLKVFQPFDDTEVNARERILNFVINNEIVFGKENIDGHITGSAWILDFERQSVLLTHHSKANKWFQLGGHSETNETIFETALREAKEESGLTTLKSLSDEIYGINIEKIPERKSEKEHFHFDIFFIFEADKEEKLIITKESKDLRWISLDQVSNITDDRSVLRMIRKMQKKGV